MTTHVKTPRKPIPLWGALLIDLVCLLVGAALLTSYFVFLPVTAVGTQLEHNVPFSSFSLPCSGEKVEEQLQSLVMSQKKGDAKREVLQVYADHEKQMVITKNEIGEGNDKITWYTADVYVTSAKLLQTNVSVDEQDEIKNQSVKGQAEDVHALFAITGDTFSMSKDGVIVRNGYLYRADLRTSNDICVLSASGELKIVEKRDYMTMEDIVEMGAWQVWTFGPALLDDNGNAKSKFNIAASHLSDLSYEHPRTAIGMKERGHYIFVLVDGRNEGYSKGATFPELAEIMVNEGCTVAYNLDGGRSAVMASMKDGKIGHVNDPYKGGRGISDIIYITAAKEGASE